MNKELLLQKFGYFDMVHSVTLKAVAQLKDDQLDFRPTAEIRTVKELLSHTFGQERVLAEGIPSGNFSQEEMNSVEAEGMKSKTVDELIAFARDCHQRAKSAFERASEEQITGNIDTCFGSFPGWQRATFAYDEH